MQERKSGLPIVSLILGAIGCFFNGSATVADGNAMIGFGMVLTLIAFICAIISLLSKKYNKVCAIIGVIFCIISFIFFNNWSNDKAKYETNLKEYNSKTYTITFDTDGGQEIKPMTVHPNTYLSPVIPYKEGYEFKSWTLNGTVFNFSGYVNSRITSDVILKANYVKINKSNSKSSGGSSSSSSSSSSSGSSSSSNYNNSYKNTSYGYQKIYDEYSQKLINAGPTSSISEMANILAEGTTKMAQYMYSAKGTDGQYATYQSWVDKLYDVYMSNCR